MKKILSAIMAFLIAISMSVPAFAATEELGKTDFSSRVGDDGRDVTKTVRSTLKAFKGTYRISGIYHESEGKEVFRLMNEERAAEGLKKLTWESELVQPAIQRALEQYLYYGNRIPLSHTRPNGSDGLEVSKLAHGENLAGGDADAYSVMDGWMHSPDHRDNILDPDFTSVAVACVETDQMVYWVQLFRSTKKVRADGTVVDADGTVSSAPAAQAKEATTGEVTSKSLVADLNKAKTTAAITPVTLKNADKLSTAALKGASDWGVTNKKTVSITASTLTSTGKSTQGQLTLNPASFTKNKNALKTGVRVDKASVSDTLNAFYKAYPKATKAAMIKCDQTGNYGGTVAIGAKADLTGLDSKKLVFYTYDAKTGKATKLNIGTQGYSIDKNKYLRFNTTKGGYIVVTDKAI